MRCVTGRVEKAFWGPEGPAVMMASVYIPSRPPDCDPATSGSGGYVYSLAGAWARPAVVA